MEVSAPVDTPDDASLVIRLQDGDMGAFESLVRRYQAPLLAFARRTLGDAGEAEDVVQDALLQLWHRAGSIREPAAFTTWIYRIVAHGCFDVLRRRRRRETTPCDVHELIESRAAQPVGASTLQAGFPQQQAETNAAVAALSTVLAELPDKQRMIWLLFELQGLTYDEISQLLGISLTSVRGKLFRARRSIAEKMAVWR